METEVEVLSVKRVLVTTTARSLAALGITVEPRIRILSLQNLGQSSIYYDVGVIDTGAPGGTDARSAELPGGDSVTLALRYSGAIRLGFVTAAGSSQMNVQQEGD